MNKHDRRFDRAREALQDGRAAAEESTRAIGNGYFTAAQAIGVFNMKLIEMAQGNAMAAVNFGKQLRDREIHTKDVISIPVSAKVPPGYSKCYTGRDIQKFKATWSGLICLVDRRAKAGAKLRTTTI